MKALILAAGWGKRLAPLTDTLPKPLIPVNGKPMIDYHLSALVCANITQIVINTAYRGAQLREHVGDGSRYGCDVTYSLEPEDDPLETAGGIKQALALLDDEPFLVVNADIFTDFPFARLCGADQLLSTDQLAYCVCVPNPDHHPEGDFTVEEGLLGVIREDSHHRYTFSGIAVYHPNFFSDIPAGKGALSPYLKKMADEKKIHVEVYTGLWLDVGTPDRLAAAHRAAAGDQ